MTIQIPRAILETIQVAKLPAFPKVLARLMEAYETDDASWSELAAIIGADSGLAARVLLAAGAVANRRAQRVTALEPALMLLGRDPVRTIAISASVYQVFNQFPAGHGFPLASYWQHCLECAALSRLLATSIAYARPEEAYLAGLMHDVGQLMLGSGIAGRYRRLRAGCADERCLPRVEIECLGASHAEIGGWVMDRWHLDSFIVDAVRYHHSPPAHIVDTHPLVRIVAVAERLCFGAENGETPESAEILLGLGTAEIESLIAQARQKVGTIAESLGVDLSAAAGGADPAHAVPASADGARLVRRVEDAAVIGSVQPLLGASDLEQLLESVRLSMAALFGATQIRFLLAAPREKELRGVSLPGDGGMFAEVAIPVATSISVIAESVRKNDVCICENAPGIAEPRCIVDAQVTRLLAAEAFLGVPLLAGGRVIGAAVIAGPAWEVRSLAGQARIMMAFAGFIAPRIEDAVLQRNRGRLASPEQPGAELARAVVHEVNNPLSIIRNYALALKLTLGEGAPAVSRDLDTINEEIDRIAAIVRRLADSTHTGELADTDVNALVSGMLSLWERTLFTPSSIAVELDLDPGCPTIRTDQNSLKQVLLNLAMNAAEAMAGGGRLAIVTRDNVNRGGACFVRIEVRDDGPGIPAPMIERLFSPVRSTKSGDHAGLGLAICREAVNRIGGEITCIGGGKGGACFEILLPKKTA